MDSGVVKLHLNKLVTDYSFEETKFYVSERGAESGEWIKADVILAADGVKSKARGAMLKRKGETDDGEQTR